MAGAKLLDFGLARWRGAGDRVVDDRRDQRSLTQTGAILGTIQYMAPEQLEGRDGRRAQRLFALGAVLYEMVTGRRRSRARAGGVVAAILTSQPPPPSTISGSLPAAARPRRAEMPGERSRRAVADRPGSRR